MNDLAGAIADHIRANGPIGFDEFVAHALYTPGRGFYARGGGAGRRRDFLTSPEVGPLFGAVVARALDTWWNEAGRPSHFPVVEAGAGPGTLARSILAAEPACAEALRLVLVEPARSRWDTHPEAVESREALPAPGELGAGPVVVLANELLDNLPFGLVERHGDVWVEIGVDVADASAGGHGAPGTSPAYAGDEPGKDASAGLPGAGGVHADCELETDAPAGASADPRFVEVHFAMSEKRQAWCHGRAGRAVGDGARIPVLADAAAWLGDALDLAGAGGRVVVLDYASHSRELAQRPWTDWVRTYADHGRGSPPLEDPGSQDITVEVPVDQLATVSEPTSDRSQADWLRAHGIEGLVEEGRRIWAETGAAGGLAAISGRSRVHEAEALLDPAGLGAFRVLEWAPDSAGELRSH